MYYFFAFNEKHFKLKDQVLLNLVLLNLMLLNLALLDRIPGFNCF